jgi:MFS transporter, DHA1 family, inner membrane transport protein
LARQGAFRILQAAKNFRELLKEFWIKFFPMFSREEKFLLAVLACIQFSHIVDFMILMPMGPKLMRVFAIDPHKFSLLVSSYTLSAGISSFLASMYIDRFDRKSALMFFYMGFAVGTVACGLAPTYGTLLTFRCVTGAFGGVLSTLILSIIADTIPLSRRATAFGINSASFSVASVAGVPFSLFLADKYDWHAPFMFLGVVSLVAWTLGFLFIPPMRQHLQNAHPEKKIFRALTNVYETPNLKFALVFIFCVIFGQFSVIPFLSPSLVANAGLGEDKLSFIYLVGGIVSMFSSPFAGRMADKYGRKIVFQIGAILSLIPVMILTHLGPTPIPLILTVVAFFFLTMGGRMVPAMATMASSVSQRDRGGFMSISACFQQLALAAGSYVAGLIVTKDAQGHLVNYNYVGFITIVFSLIAMWLVTKIKEVS